MDFRDAAERKEHDRHERAVFSSDDPRGAAGCRPRDDRRTQRLKTIERCQGQVDKLKQQRVDIDATIKELEGFIALVKAQTAEHSTQGK